MSTRCLIGLLNKNGTIDAVYCHHDGYVEGGVGETLQRYYNDINKIVYLLQNGGMSSLSNVSEECDFYNDGDDARHFNSIEDYLENGGDRDFHYLFNNGKWFVYPMHWDEKSDHMSSSLIEGQYVGDLL